MERRHIDLEMKMFESSLHGRNQTLDILMADRMRYWLAGWKRSYAIAFDTDNYRGPDLRESECLGRIKDLEACIAERENAEDFGHANRYRIWLEAIKATYRQSGGKGLPEDKPAAEDGAEPEETPAQAEAPPSPEAMAKLPLMTRKSQVARLTGQKLSRTADSNEVNQAYAAWYAKWYQATYGSEYRSQAA